MPRLLAPAMIVCSLFTGASGVADAAADSHDFGVLVMAHGADPEWNATVRAAVAPIATEWPVEIAFGMADPVTLHEAVLALQMRDVQRIGVVRLFISGASWLERTEQILGLVPGAASHTEDGAADGHFAPPYRIPSTASFALSREGMADAPEVESILRARVTQLSREPALEDVILLAHGVGTPEANAQWQALIGARASGAFSGMGFRRVVVETLAEDWPELRAGAEARIRADVARATEGGGVAVVVPFRLSGFGPYAQVLEGLDYVADGTGLLPHPAITDWIRRQARELAAGSFRQPLR